MFKKLYVLFLVLSGTFILAFGMVFAGFVIAGSGQYQSNNVPLMHTYEDLIASNGYLIMFGIIIVICVCLSIVFAILDKQKKIINMDR